MMASGLQQHHNKGSFSTESDSRFDDDGRPQRTGTLLTASAHIITAVIGSGVLSLAWAIAQLGWIAGPISLVMFSFITGFTSSLLAECYRCPATGKRSYNYMDVVRATLGEMQCKLCGVAQYANLVGATIGYTITASISMVAVKRSNCFHKGGHSAGCHTSNNPYMIIFAITQIILSQIPNFHELSGLSMVAAVMSFTYSFIGLGLAAAEVAGGGKHATTSLTGVVVGVDVTGSEKVWRSLQALGNIAFAYAYSMVLVEIQDTLRSSPPENEVMKKASYVAVTITTVFYALCGTLGYAAFGNDAPGNFLTGFGFYEPFWLVDLGNVCIVVHLVGAYQLFSQPIYTAVEDWCFQKWPESGFVTKGYPITLPSLGVRRVNMFRVIWRSGYVILTAVLAMAFPFFNGVVGLLGAIGFWPLTVYFPVEMYISRSQIRKYSIVWLWLKVLSWTCLIVSLLAAAGSIQGIIQELVAYKPFNSVS